MPLTEANKADGLVREVGGVVGGTGGTSSNHLETCRESSDSLAGAVAIEKVVDVESRRCVTKKLSIEILLTSEEIALTHQSQFVSVLILVVNRWLQPR